jgi:plastocyanin
VQTVKRHNGWLAAITVVMAAFLLAAATGASNALAADPVKITVKTTDTGFQPNDIEVPQGSVVELTFLWDHKSYPNEEHIIVLEGYKLEADKIDSLHKEATIKFIADKPGTFTFKCDLECDLHDALQKGQLKVVAGAGGGAAPVLTPTKFVVDPSGVTVRGDTVTLVGFLKDDKGNPVTKAEVAFFVEKTFAGTKASVEVGAAKTGPTGLAKLTYQPRRTEADKVTIRFEGVGIYAPVEQIIDVPSMVAPGTGFTEAPKTLASIRAGAPFVLVMVMSAIWLTFAGILYTAWTVSRVRARR